MNQFQEMFGDDNQNKQSDLKTTLKVLSQSTLTDEQLRGILVALGNKNSDAPKSNSQFADH